MSPARALPLVLFVLYAFPTPQATAVTYAFDTAVNPTVQVNLFARQGNVLVTVGPFSEVAVTPLVDDLEVTLPAGVAISGELLLGLTAADQSLVFMDAIGVPATPVTLTIDRIDLTWPKAGDVWQVELGTPVPTHPTLAYEIEGTLQVGSTVEPFSFIATCGGFSCMNGALVEVTASEARVVQRFPPNKATYRSIRFDLGTLEAVDFEMDLTFAWDEIRLVPEPSTVMTLVALAALGMLARVRAEPRR